MSRESEPFVLPFRDGLDRAASGVPGRIAVVDGDITLTYAALRAQADLVAAMLQQTGVARGDRVALILPNSWQLIASLLGVGRAGAVAVPMSPLLTSVEIARQLSDADVSVVIVHESAVMMTNVVGHAEDLRSTLGVDLVVVEEGPPAEAPWARARADLPGVSDSSSPGTALILYTSGSTGEPKGVEITHDNLAAVAGAHQDFFGLDSKTPDTYLAAVPLVHALGLASVVVPWLSYAGTIVMMPRFDAKQAPALIATEQISIVVVVPTMLARLLQDEQRTPVRVLLVGAAGLPEALVGPAVRKFMCPVSVGYGMSETTGPISFAELSGATPNGWVGRPIKGLDVRVATATGGTQPTGDDDVGEIQVAGSSVAAGYWANPEATAKAREDGWFRTGDVGRVDKAGNIHLTGRLKDVIIRGGYKVHPGEVENVLTQHAAVAAAAVVGRDHPTLGQEVRAFVVLESHDSGLPEGTCEALRAFASEKLAAYKVPREITVLSELPMNPLGKVIKDRLP